MGKESLIKQDYQSYVQKKESIRILHDHFESNFSLAIQPLTAEQKKEEAKKGEESKQSKIDKLSKGEFNLGQAAALNLSKKVQPGS